MITVEMRVTKRRRRDMSALQVKRLLRRKKAMEKISNLTPRQREVYDGLAQHGVGGQTPHYLAVYLGYKESAYVSAQIRALVKKGLIVKIEGLRGKNTRYKIV